ncbi:TAXI family TRAP transporter solute-binding subunit, partial [Pseudonocardia pini]|uniref:TAXI family TRAP transporter solute-binding subunit n=1 Tax=Pseudonocardia pini TaxID=2758030 RepID=UPI0015F0AB93
AVGTPISGYYVIARRLLETAGIDPDRGIAPRELGLSDSIDALRAGTVDAFFWSGGLPTAGITELAADTPIRLLDLADVLEEVRGRYPVYSPGTVPASAYDIGEPVATLFVRNFLLVPAALEPDLAAELVRSMFALQGEVRAAVGDQLTALALRRAPRISVRVNQSRST